MPYQLCTNLQTDLVFALRAVVYQELKESFFTLENGEEKDYVT